MEKRIGQALYKTKMVRYNAFEGLGESFLLSGSFWIPEITGIFCTMCTAVRAVAVCIPVLSKMVRAKPSGSGGAGGAGRIGA